MAGVRDFYAHKNVFLTGATGFLGKVILEKILRTIPDIGTVYVLIRRKKDMSSSDRLKKSVLDTACFDRVRKINPQFDQQVMSKVIPVEGDVDKDNLGLSQEDRKKIIENVHIVINCAASVDFNARLDLAIRMNVLGSMRMLELAKQIMNLENFVHISTCYVNSDKRGLIEEKIYPNFQNPNVVVKEILSMSPEQIEAKAPSFLRDYPNTYTFSKFLAERMLAEHRQHVSLTIVRPSIIGCSWNDPVPGWLDAVSAATALYLFTGLGIIKVGPGSSKYIGDQIPVDFCANAIIVAGSAHANSKDLKVIHCGTSASNPVTWGETIKAVTTYWNLHPPEKRIASSSFKLLSSEKMLKMEQFTRKIPVLLLYKLTEKAPDDLPLKQSAKKLYKAHQRSESVIELFGHFTSHEWIFLNHNLQELQKFCTKEELDIFYIDTKLINWHSYLTYFCWGVHYYILKENVDPPTEINRTDALRMPITNFISKAKNWIRSKNNGVKSLSKKELTSRVLASERLKKEIKNLMASKNINNPQYEDYLYKIAEDDCNLVISDYEAEYLKVMGLVVQSTFRKVFDQLLVNEEKILKLKDYDSRANGPLVFVLNHRSYVDSLVLSYVFLTFAIKYPQIVGTEDFLKMTLTSILPSRSSELFSQRKQKEYYEIYKAVQAEYIENLLVNNGWLRFFIEGTRSRNGKTLAPKLDVLGIIVESVLDGKIPNAQIVPVTINYERLLEDNNITLKDLAIPNNKEPLNLILHAADILRSNFGKIYCEIGDPISLNGMISQCKLGLQDINIQNLQDKAQRKAVIRHLGQHIVYNLNENLVVMPTSVISATLLANRKGIKEEELKEKAILLTQEINFRNGKLGIPDINYPSTALRSGIAHMEHLMENIDDSYYLLGTSKNSKNSALMLGCYRNMLGHLFWNEALIACAIASFGKDDIVEKTVSIEDLWKEVSFLQSLLSLEFQVREKISKENLYPFLKLMAYRKIVELYEDSRETLVKVNAGADTQMRDFLCHLVWPFVSSYWVTMGYLLINKKNPSINLAQKRLVKEIQLFAEYVYEKGLTEFYEACSHETITNALNSLKDKGILIKINNRSAPGKEELLNFVGSENNLRDLELHLQRFLKVPFNKTVDSLTNLTKRTVLLGGRMPKL